MNIPRGWPVALSGALLLGLCAPAAADVTLTGVIVDATCGVRGTSGTTLQACSALPQGTGFHVTIAPGETAFVNATLRYEYSDDGLRLPVPFPLQLDYFGVSFRNVNYEVGEIVPLSNACRSRACGLPPSLDVGGSTAFLVLGENDKPDHLTGELPLSSFVSVLATSGIAYPMDVFVNWQAITAGVAAIPEPAAWTLLLPGLAAMLLVRRNARPRAA